MSNCPAPVPWHKGPMLGFDLETTGVDVETDRIVTFALIDIQPGEPARTDTGIVDPDIDIPDQAAAIHGITTERARNEGMLAPRGAVLIRNELARRIEQGIPIVGMNLAYDLTMLDRECRRWAVPTLSDQLNLAPVIDVRVLDKAMDPYRKGGRKLTDLANHYRIRLDQAHDAGADALAACRIAYAIAARHPELQIHPLKLHEQQIRWAAQQTADFAAYRRRQGQPLDNEDGTWPVRPAHATIHTGA